MKRVIAFLLCIILAISAVPSGLLAVSAAEGGNTVSAVFLNGTSGSDDNDGSTAENAVATLAKAIEVANTCADAKKVYVVVTGETVMPEAQYVLPANNVPIVVTSVYGGNDYKAQGAKFITHNSNCAAIHFNGTFSFEKITIKTANTNSIFALQYNSFTAGEGIDFVTVKSAANSSSYPILLVGCNTNSGVAYDKAALQATFTNDVNIEVNSGTWAYIRGGDRDSMSTFDGNMTININGGTFKNGNTSATSYYVSGNGCAPTGKCSYGPNAKIVMNLNGGTMDTLIGCSYVAGTSGHTSAADITININDGAKITNKIVAVQSTNTEFNGKLTFNIYGGDLSEIVESKLANLSVANGGSGTVTVNYDPDDADSVAAYNALTDVCLDDTDVITGTVKADDTPVIYLKDGGTGNGSAPAKAMGNLQDAYNALDLSKECFIVICGTYTQTAHFDPWVEYTGKVTLTSVYGGVDYRETADAEYVVGGGYRFFLYGDTAFDDINVRLEGNFWLIIAQCNAFYAGEGFEAAFDDATDGSSFAKGISVLGGFQGTVGLAAENLNCSEQSKITVLSGSNWVITPYNRQLTGGNHSGKATVTIGGDAYVSRLYYTSVNRPGVTCGEVELTVKDNATVKYVLASPDANNGLDPISVESFTVNWIGGNIEAASLTDSSAVSASAAKNTAVITNGSTLKYTAEAAESASFDAVSALFDTTKLVTEGDFDTESPAYELRFLAASLSLYNDIAVNFKANKAEMDAAGYAEPYAVFEFNGNTYTVTEYTVETMKLNGEKTEVYVFPFKNLAPDRMNDTITATLRASFGGKNYAGDAVEYSVARYCYNQLKNLDEKTALATVCVDLLNYGAAAQEYTGHNVNSLANAELTDEQRTWATQTDRAYTDVTARDNAPATEIAAWKAASLVLRENITVEMKFAADDIAGLYVEFEMNGKKFKVDEFGYNEQYGLYVVEFNKFTAINMSDEIKATVRDSEGNAVSKALTYSVESYAHNKRNDAGVGALVKSMMKYGDSAIAFGKESGVIVDDGLLNGAAYFIKNGSLALAGETFGTIHGELAAMSDDDGDLDSIWYFELQNDGTYLIRSAVCGYYLSVKNNNTADGAEIALYNPSLAHAQRWKVIVVNNGYLLRCVDTEGYLGNALQVADKASATVWTLELAAAPGTELPSILPLKGATGAPASCPEIIKYDGTYYNVNMTGGIKIKTSKDLVTWTNVTTVFDTKPAWIYELLSAGWNSELADPPAEGEYSIVAPGYYMVGGKLRIYYAATASGSRNSVIGLVDCETPTSGFTDRGQVIRSYKYKFNGSVISQTDYNCIDPNIFEDDDGKVYLVWGSYAEGIYLQRIDPETGLLHETDTKQYKLADAPDFMEAPYLIKRGDYYYLFVAMGSLKKTADYYWAVGRSTSLTGPYLDKDGNPMLDGYTSALTEWKDGVHGVGHAQPFCDDDGQWYMVSEAWEYRTAEETSPIKLHISKIVWNEAGWPVTALSTNLLEELAEK